MRPVSLAYCLSMEEYSAGNAGTDVCELVIVTALKDLFTRLAGVLQRILAY